MSNTGFTVQIFIHGKLNRKYWNILNLFPPSLRATILVFFPLDFSVLFYLYVLLAAHILADAQAKKEVITRTSAYFVVF